MRLISLVPLLVPHTLLLVPPPGEEYQQAVSNDAELRDDVPKLDLVGAPILEEDDTFVGEVGRDALLDNATVFSIGRGEKSKIGALITSTTISNTEKWRRNALCQRCG